MKFLFRLLFANGLHIQCFSCFFIWRLCNFCHCVLSFFFFLILIVLFLWLVQVFWPGLFLCSVPLCGWHSLANSVPHATKLLTKSSIMFSVLCSMFLFLFFWFIFTDFRHWLTVLCHFTVCLILFAQPWSLCYKFSSIDQSFWPSKSRKCCFLCLILFQPGPCAVKPQQPAASIFFWQNSRKKLKVETDAR